MEYCPGWQSKLMVGKPIAWPVGDRNGLGSEWGSEARFAAYVEALGQVLGHADRHEAMRDYCVGLSMPLARKSVDPPAAVTVPSQVAAEHPRARRS